MSISTVTDNLIETVRYKVEEFTGMEIEKINIYVEGVVSLIKEDFKSGSHYNKC